MIHIAGGFRIFFNQIPLLGLSGHAYVAFFYLTASPHNPLPPFTCNATLHSLIVGIEGSGFVRLTMSFTLSLSPRSIWVKDQDRTFTYE